MSLPLPALASAVDSLYAARETAAAPADNPADLPPVPGPAEIGAIDRPIVPAQPVVLMLPAPVVPPASVTSIKPRRRGIETLAGRADAGRVSAAR